MELNFCDMLYLLGVSTLSAPPFARNAGDYNFMHIFDIYIFNAGEYNSWSFHLWSNFIDKWTTDQETRLSYIVLGSMKIWSIFIFDIVMDECSDRQNNKAITLA